MDQATKIRFRRPAVLSMPETDAEKLIAAGSGDAALLYIYILRHNGELDLARAAFDLRRTEKDLRAALARLEEMGMQSISFITGTPFVPRILEALELYRPALPLVWNSSGYSRVEMLREQTKIIDIFLPDFKYASEKTAVQLAAAPDYFEVTLAAIQAMCRQTGAPVYDEEGIMQRGTIVRHLILPLRTAESIAILDAIAAELPEGTPVSLMRQYTPMNDVKIAGLDRRLTSREYIRVRDHMFDLGLDGYLQQKESADSAYTPAFMDEESIALFPNR